MASLALGRVGQCDRVPQFDHRHRKHHAVDEDNQETCDYALPIFTVDSHFDRAPINWLEQMVVSAPTGRSSLNKPVNRRWPMAPCPLP